MLPPLTVARVFGAWTFDPGVAAVLAVLLCAYLVGVRAARHRGTAWPRWRTVGFAVVGLGGVVVCTMSSLAVYNHTLLWPLAVQVTLLLSVVPLGLVLGDPLGLVTAALPERARCGWVRLLHARAVRIVTFPPLAAAVILGTQFAVFFTGYLSAALAHPAVLHLLYLQVALTGCLFCLPIHSAQLLPAWCTQPVRMAFVMLDGLLDAIPGIAVFSTSSLLAGGYYATVHRNWGPSVHWDQTIAGGLMLTLSEAVALPFIAILFYAWIREDTARAARLDHELDLTAAQQAALPGSGPGSTPDPSRPDRPWWETDPGPLLGRARTRPSRSTSADSPSPDP